MARKQNSVPDSDQSVRGLPPEVDPEEGIMGDGAQTSHKSGKHSSREKLAASRPEHGTGAQAKPVDGADGDPHPDDYSHKGNPGLQGELANKALKHSQDPNVKQQS
jgi:hypothetical protein